MENTGIIKVQIKIAKVRFAVAENGDCKIDSRTVVGVNAKKAAADIKKEYGGKVIILEKSYTIEHFNVIGGTFVPCSDPETEEE